MRKLTATLCLTIAVLVGSAGCGNLPKFLEKYSYGSEGGKLPPCPGRYSKSTWTDCSGYVLFHGGVKYQGEFKDDKFHGQGTLTYAEDKIKEGIWEYGELKYAQKGSPTHKEPTQSPPTLPMDKAEKKCAQLGFTIGTEKFGDCVMKLLN
mgnify:CR=1 FL=1